MERERAPGAPAAGPLLCECLRTSSCPSARPTASSAQFGDRPTLSTGAAYLLACVTRKASSS